MTALRGLVELVSFLLLVLVALLGLAAFLLAITGWGLAEEFGLAAVRDGVGGFLDGVERGRRQAVALAAGAGGMLLGLLLLVGLLAPRRERLVVVEDAPEGRLAARRRALQDIGTSLVSRARGVTGAKVKVKPRRRGKGGKLSVLASHPRTTPDAEATESAKSALEPLTGDFELKPRVRAKLGQTGERAQ